MINVYRCHLEAHSPIYYSTREASGMQNTADHLQNTALSYALHFAVSNYHRQSGVVTYHNDFLPLVKAGLYVTPATPRHVDFIDTSINPRPEGYWSPLKEQPAYRKDKNYPSYQTHRQIAPQSTFIFYILSLAPIDIPVWIRLGGFNASCQITVQAHAQLDLQSGTYTFKDALESNDLHMRKIISHDYVKMPPHILFRNFTATGRWYTGILPDEHGNNAPFQIPASMSYLSNPSLSHEAYIDPKLWGTEPTAQPA